MEISDGILNCEISGDPGAWGFAGVGEIFYFDWVWALTRWRRWRTGKVEGERRDEREMFFLFIKILGWESTVTMYIYMVTVDSQGDYVNLGCLMGDDF
jgi:hypothetical protein